MSFDTLFIERLIAAQGYQRPQNICEITKYGVVNQVFHLRFKDGSDMVLRLNEDLGKLREYQKEHWCLKKARKAEVPVPDSISVGVFEELPFHLQSFVSGRNGREEENQLWVYETLGIYAKKLLDIQVSGFGPALKNPDTGEFTDVFNPTFEEKVSYNKRMLTKDDLLLSLGVYQRGERSKILEMLDFLMSQKFAYGLCHGDLAPQNTLVDGDKITLIDFGGAHIGPQPFSDFLALWEADETQLLAFLKGYAMTKEEYEGLRDQRLAYNALWHLDKLRWALDHVRDSSEYIVAAKRALQEYLS